MTVFRSLDIDIEYNLVEVGCQLGLTVPKTVSSEYPCAIISDERPSAGYGTQLQDEQYSLQHFFDENNYKLSVEFYYPDSLSSFEVRLLQLLEQECHILVCYSVKEIFNQPHNSGHVSLIESKIDDSQLTIVSHGVKSGTRRINVSIADLYNAIVLHSQANMAGLWIITRI
jgi:hypothetical protein